QQGWRWRVGEWWRDRWGRWQNWWWSSPQNNRSSQPTSRSPSPTPGRPAPAPKASGTPSGQRRRSDTYGGLHRRGGLDNFVVPPPPAALAEAGWPVRQHRGAPHQGTHSAAAAARAARRGGATPAARSSGSGALTLPDRARSPEAMRRERLRLLDPTYDQFT
ncbi:unnamed protein product, partial [Amoebophrya sp. A120]